MSADDYDDVLKRAGDIGVEKVITFSKVIICYMHSIT